MDTAIADPEKNGPLNLYKVSATYEDKTLFLEEFKATCAERAKSLALDKAAMIFIDGKGRDVYFGSDMEIDNDLENKLTHVKVEIL